MFYTQSPGLGRTTPKIITCKQVVVGRKRILEVWYLLYYVDTAEY